MAWFVCGTIEECWVAATEAIGSYHTHLGSVSEEYMVFKHSNSKRIWYLGYSTENNFPGEQQHFRNSKGQKESFLMYNIQCNFYLSKPL